MNDIKNISSCVSVCYHRISDIKGKTLLYPDDGLTIFSEIFEKQILYFKKHYGVFNLKNTYNKKKSILITFDDGYKDLYNIVLPIIEKHDIPILIFISTSFVENNAKFCWWIDLWYNLLNLDKLNFEIDNVNKLYNLYNYEEKVVAYRLICSDLLKHNLNEIREYFLKHNLKTDHEKDFLTIEQLKVLSQHKLVTIGYHSHFHLNYSVEKNESIENDMISINDFFIKNNILNSIKLFAFCFGLKPKLSIQSIMFNNYDYLFSLGLRERLFNKNPRIIPRVNITNEMSFTNLRFKFIFSNIVNFFKRYKN